MMLYEKGFHKYNLGKNIHLAILLMVRVDFQIFLYKFLYMENMINCKHVNTF
jgi:hypothetical protein